MSISINVTTELDRPVEEAFEFVTTIENDWDWKEDLIEIQLPNGAMGVGTTWSQEVEGVRGTDEIGFECTGYEPPNRFTYRMTSGFFGDRVRASEARYTFSNDGDQTRMPFSGTVRVDGLMRLIQPLLAWMLRNQLEDSLN